MQRLSQGRFRILPLAACTAVSLLLAACGGGGGGSSSSPSAVTPGGGSGSGSGSGTSSKATAPASVAISFLQYQPVQTASTHRKAAFISPATQSIAIAVTVANGTPVTNPQATTVNVGPTSANCTAAGAEITCTATIDAPVGSDVISVSSYQGQNGSGTQLGTTLAPITIVQNTANRIPLDIGGTIASLELYLSNPNPTLASPTSLVVIVPLDASGAVIVNPGNYNPSITVTSSDTSGAFSLLLDGTASGTSATVASPNDQVVLSYNGNGTTPVSTTVTATAGTATASGNAHAGTGPPALVGAGSGTGYTPGTAAQFIFTGSGQTGNLAVSGGVAPYTIASTNTAVATVGGTSPNFTVTSVGVGSTTITVTDSASSHFSYDVTVAPPGIAIAVQSCGSSATCTTSSITFPQYTASGVTPQETGTIAVTGGTGTYAYYFASTGSTTSADASVAQSGNTFTIVPTGAGNDTLVISSGGQYAVYGIVTATTSPLAALLPSAMGMLIMQNSGGVPKAFSLALPSSVVSYTQLTGATDNNFNGPPSQPGAFTSTPMTPGTGSVRFADASGNTATLPYTIFGVTFDSCDVDSVSIACAYAGASSSTDAPLPSPQDEQMSLGEVDAVDITGMGGTLSASSGNTNIVTASASGSTVTVTAVGVGATTVALTDSATGATATYTVSVTSTTIPIQSRGRSR